MDLIEFETTAGTFTVELYRLRAPKTCYNFTELVKIGTVVFTTVLYRFPFTASNAHCALCSNLTGYYNDTIFHRVIRDFVRVLFCMSLCRIYW